MVVVVLPCSTTSVAHCARPPFCCCRTWFTSGFQNNAGSWKGMGTRVRSAVPTKRPSSCAVVCHTRGTCDSVSTHMTYKQPMLREGKVAAFLRFLFALVRVPRTRAAAAAPWLQLAEGTCHGSRPRRPARCGKAQAAAGQRSQATAWDC